MAQLLVTGKKYFQHVDDCSDHGVTSDVEVIPMGQINEAYERMLKGDVNYRL